MDTAAATKSPILVRWLVPAVLLFVCVGLIMFGVRREGVLPETIHTLALLSTALAVYASVIYPASGAFALGFVVFIALLITWAVQRTPVLGWQVAAFTMLVGMAMWQQRARSRRVLRLKQLLDDLGDDGHAKGQASSQAEAIHDALQKKLARYTKLQTIAEELSNSTDLASIANLAVERAFTLIGKSDACLLFLVDQDIQGLSLIASKKGEAVPAVRAKHGDQFDRHVLRSHRPLMVNDTRRDFRFTSRGPRDRRISAVIACPLLVGQAPTGVLRLDSTEPDAYNQDDLRFLDILLDLVATAITNARLFAQTQKLAVTDGLTGLMLRRPFLEQLTREMTRAGRSREPVSVVMVDVDNFKSYNDTFGHTAGDLVLKGVAEVLRTVVPPGGVAGRFGGEEFIVLLPRMPRHQAGDIAEKIRQTVERELTHGGRRQDSSGESLRRQPVTPPPLGDTPLRHERSGGLPTEGRQTPTGGGHLPRGGGVTVSLGVASFPDDAQVELELIRVADQRLYQAKHDGRNVVCAA